MNAGTLFMQQKGFTVLLHDTTDLKRIGELLHGDLIAPLPAGKTPVSQPVATGQKAAVAVAPGSNLNLLNPGNGGGGSGGVPVKGGGSGSSPGSGAKGPGAAGQDPFLLHSHSYRVSFVNASDAVTILPDKVLPAYTNYFIGDQKTWTTNCKSYQGIFYKNMYEGIDVHYYTDMGFVKYDLVVHPGADPNQIILQYDGQTSLSVRKNKVYVQTTVGTVTELEPHSYQVNAQGRSDLPCSYVLLPGNRIKFNIKNYSPDATVVIDPTEVFCSFTGSKSDNWGYTATYDNAGNLYLGGIVLDETGQQNSPGGGGGFLVSPGAFQTTYQGGNGTDGQYDYDVGIMKLSGNGSSRVYATYLGGSGDEQPHSMIVDNSGDLIVTGRTSSGNFPLKNAGPGDTKGLDYDIFITKFTPDGSGLIGSRRIGGSGPDGVNYKPKYAELGAHDLRLNYGDDGRGEVILDAAGNIYVAACSQSTDFPVTPGAFQQKMGVGSGSYNQDGVLIKTSPDLSTILFSSYLGGSGVDAATVLALSPLDNTIWVGGGTMSTDFPGTGNGTVYNSKSNGGIDGFISVVSNDGGTLIRSSYFGTSSTDMIFGLDFDKFGFPYIMGTTSGVMPVVNSPFNQGGNQATGKQFITKLKTDLSGIVYSANFGPGGQPYPSMSPTAFLVDRCQNVYVAGWGGGPNIYELYTSANKVNGTGTNGLTATSDAIRGTTDNSDFYFFVLQRNAASQLYGSFFGEVNSNPSSYGDHVDGGTSRFDKQGVIYEAICANCYGAATFPTTPGAYKTANGTGSLGCNEAGVKIAFNFAGVAAGLKTVTHGRGDSVGCVPLTVTLSDTIRNAKSYIWIFGDGTQEAVSSATYQLNHTYTATGTYLVTLIAIDSSSCNVADTAYRTIVVGNNPATIDFDFSKVPPCTSLSYVFNNLSTAPPALPFTNTSFEWNFGDGQSGVPAGLAQITHSFPSPGPYNVTLSLVDTNYCNYPLDTTKLLYVAQNVKAQFTTPAIGCAPDSAVFTNTSVAGQQYYWNFGDGSPIDSVDVSPVHLYINPGNYTITLTAVDSNTCNITDTYSVNITMYTKPGVQFTDQPVPSEPNTPTVFVPTDLTSTTSPVVKYLWEFGDGSSETKTEPDTVVHLYIRSDTFNVCLIGFNAEGCTDTVCHPVQAIIHPLLDVPNAFTPGRFGQNAIVKVMGFGITHMTWRIYNRWGQCVFQSDDPYIGWDGTYRGAVQPMDVYAYTLEAEYSDGTHATKKGDITLIR